MGAGQISVDFHAGVGKVGGVLRLMYQASDEFGNPRTAVQAVSSSNASTFGNVDTSQTGTNAAYPYLQFALRRNDNGKWLTNLQAGGSWSAANTFSFINPTVCPLMADCGPGSWTDSGNSSDTNYWDVRLPDPWGSANAATPFAHIIEGLYFIDIPCDPSTGGSDMLGMSYTEASKGFRFMVADAGFMNMQGLQSSAWVPPSGPIRYSYASINVSSPVEISTTGVTTAIFDEPLSSHTDPGSFGDALRRMLALRQHNMQVKYTAYNDAGVPTTGTVYIYPDATTLNNDPNVTGTGAIGSYSITSAFDANLKPTTYSSKMLT